MKAKDLIGIKCLVIHSGKELL